MRYRTRIGIVLISGTDINYGLSVTYMPLLASYHYFCFWCGCCLRTQLLQTSTSKVCRWSLAQQSVYTRNTFSLEGKFSVNKSHLLARKILISSSNLGIKYTSASMFVLVSPCRCRESSSATWQLYRSAIQYFSENCSSGDARCWASSCEAEFVVSAWPTSSTLWEISGSCWTRHVVS
jgi:hypothetical protein